MQWALDEIRKIQKAARSGKPIMKPRVRQSLSRFPDKTLNKFSGQF
jgi:xylulose-5-phosphate/fructose-6-phosphate phosphoketolase